MEDDDEQKELEEAEERYVLTEEEQAAESFNSDEIVGKSQPESHKKGGIINIIIYIVSVLASSTIKPIKALIWIVVALLSRQLHKISYQGRFLFVL